MSLTAGKTVIVMFEMTADAPAATRNVLGCNTSSSGWELQINNTGSMFFVTRNAGATSFGFGKARKGLMCVLFTRRADGSLWAYFNGGPGQQLHATLPTYTDPSGTAVFAIGRNNPAINANTLPEGMVYAIAHFTAEVNEATARLMTSLTRLDRYHLTPTVTGHANLVFHFAADRDLASGGSIVAGLGSAPPTWTVNGTVARNVVESELVYTAQASWFHDNRINALEAAQQETAHYRHNAFARLKFLYSGTKMVVDFAATLTAANPAYLCVSAVKNGVFEADLTVGQYTMDGSRDITFSGGSKTIELWDGVQSKSGATIESTSLMAIRVPASTPLQIFTPTAPADRLVLYGDSITVGTAATSAAANGWAMRTRLDFPGSTTVEAYGFRSLNSDCSSSGARTAFAAHLSNLCDGTVSNTLVLAIGTNDYGLAPWTAASFETALADLLDKLHVLRPDIVVYMAEILTRGTETANGLGSTCANYRTAQANVQAARSSYVTLIPRASLVVYNVPGTMDVDTVHLNSTGHADFYTGLKAALGYP